MTETPRPPLGRRDLWFGPVSVAAVTLSAAAAILRVYSIRTVPSEAVGVKLHFGEVVGALEPGRHFVIPFAKRIENVSLKERSHTARDVNAYSKDVKALKITITVVYRIEAAMAADYYRAGGRNFAGGLFDPFLNRTVRETIGMRTAIEIAAQREAIALEIEKNVRQRIPAGVVVTSVRVDHVDSTEE